MNFFIILLLFLPGQFTHPGTHTHMRRRKEILLDVTSSPKCQHNQKKKKEKKKAEEVHNCLPRMGITGQDSFPATRPRCPTHSVKCLSLFSSFFLEARRPNLLVDIQRFL